MNLQIPATRLIQMIAKQAEAASKSRQVAKRLADLLPLRLREIKRTMHLATKVAVRERLVLASATYEQLIEELVDINHLARQARIEYETHLMLYKARQSLQSLARAKGPAGRQSSSRAESDRTRRET